MKEINKLKIFRKWFDKFVQRSYGKKCPDFVWDCAACRANFVKDAFGSFVDDLIDTENWLDKQTKDKKRISVRRKTRSIK